ncbi:MAG: malectin domain-containing carbohydrate-binding protein, partial [Chloroflexota bacterium]
ERYGNFRYALPVPNGSYTVTLKFAEIFQTQTGQRVFHIDLEGQRVLTAFDILAEVAPNTALDKTFTTSVADGRLDVVFTSVVDAAKVSAVEVMAGNTTSPGPTPPPATPVPSPSPAPPSGGDPGPMPITYPPASEAPAPQGQPTLLASYAVKFFLGDGTYQFDYDRMMYRPRQFAAGLNVNELGTEPVTVNDPRSYQGWDVLNTPLPRGEVNIYGIYDSPDWLHLRLNRSATLAVVWRGGPSTPSWLGGWSPGGDVVVNGAATPTYVRTFPAGEVVLGSVYDPGANYPPFVLDTYLVLFAEADGTPSPVPAVPSGQPAPAPNQTCPGWVHDQYVTSGPDGRQYPTWHPTIDAVYWCYFHHEHGSDPSLFPIDYQPAYGYVNAQAGMTEPHAGFKTYIWQAYGRSWMVTHHFGTASLNRACARFHSIHVAVAEAHAQKLVADLHFLADFGVAVSTDNELPLTPPACANQYQQVPPHNGGFRRIRTVPGSANYEPWEFILRENVLGLDLPIVFATRDPIVNCTNNNCVDSFTNPHDFGSN